MNDSIGEVDRDPAITKGDWVLLVTIRVAPLLEIVWVLLTMKGKAFFFSALDQLAIESASPHQPGDFSGLLFFLLFDELIDYGH